MPTTVASAARRKTFQAKEGGVEGPSASKTRWDGWSWTLWILGAALLIRLLVGLHPHSGQGTPPQFGDYEAQRHWMEITVHTPTEDWYRETEDNPMQHWGMDYPPLSAYQSWLCGKAIQAIEPEAVELNTSRGYESQSSKVYMRWSVVLFDVLFLFPGALACIGTIYKRKRPEQRLWALASVLLQPALLLIDHGHFQYNGISLGLAAGAAAAIMNGHSLVGALLFSLSLNHKQMSLYYAPAFFFHLVGRCLQKKKPLLHISGLAITVFYTFLVCWFPWITAEYSFVHMLKRIFPFERGLYEDHVANFWCTTSLSIKWKKLFTGRELRSFCFLATFLAMLPSCLHQLWRPSKKGLLYAMANTSFSFYMFSFQVHEKSILLPLLPVALLVLEERVSAEWLAYASTFSIYPLLARDKLGAAYIALMVVYWCLMRMGEKHNKKKTGPIWARLGLHTRSFSALSICIALGLHAAYAFAPTLPRYPFLYQALITACSFVHLLGIWVDLTASQLRLHDPRAGTSSKDKGI
eukprot:scaffold461_cov321-Pavlova_lutheri.AAC.24